MAGLRQSLTRLGLCLAIAAAAEAVLGSGLEVVGIPSSGYGLGGLLWDLHAPGRVLLCSAFGLCGGYDHFVISDAWVIGEPQHPDRFELMVLGSANAVVIGLFAFLVWTALLARSRRDASGKAAV